MKLDKHYWDKIYLSNELTWDVGYTSTPLKEYFDQLKNKKLKILIPGCGNAYEAEYLLSLGFKNVYLIDWSEVVFSYFKLREHTIPDDHLFCGDFFEHKGKYDLIIEQTFFCSIDRSLRQEYAKKVHELLNYDGQLAGLLFDAQFNSEAPPYGGTKEEYIKYFEPYFEFKVFETAYNSIKPRRGREIFMILKKK